MTETIEMDNKQSQNNSPKKKVMLVLPNHRWATTAENYTMWLIHPTQICLLAAQIEDKYDVKIVDCIINDYSEKEFEEIIKREQPDVVGLSNFTHEYSKAGHVATEIIKKVNPSIITIMGGVYVISSPQLAMQDKNLDFAIRGEAEILITEFLAYLFEQGPLPQKGLVYRKEGEIMLSPRNDFITDLTSLKYPAYHLVDFLKYATRYSREATGRPRELPFARLSMTRGCPIGCTFCQVESISGGPTRYRSAEHFVGEIELLKNKYSIKCFSFDDDNLFMNKNKAKEMLKLLIQKNVNIKWQMEATAIFCMDDECIDLARQSGCQYLNFAVESGSSRVLKEIIKKPINLERTKEIAKKLRAVGIDTVANFILGSPGETWDEIRQTVKYAEELEVDYVKFFICTPLANTKMFQLAVDMGYLTKDFDFAKHDWSGGTFDTPHWRGRDLAVLRAYEWDRVNFSTRERKEKIMKMMDITEERLDEIRWATRVRANPDNKPSSKEKPKVNKYSTIKDNKMKTIIIKYDKQRCIGNGNCTRITPETFSLNDGKAILKRAEIINGIDQLEVAVNIEDEERLMNAARSCPVNAIEIIDKSLSKTLIGNKVKEEIVAEIDAKYDDEKEFVLDPAGYFLIRINKEKKTIEVGFCNERNKVILKVTGKKPIDIYQQIINKESLNIRKDHCAYLGRELQKAYLALQVGIEYVQDDELVM